jgi:hypothetical protein
MMKTEDEYTGFEPGFAPWDNPYLGPLMVPYVEEQEDDE